MEITQCANCGTRVIPTADRACPSCGRSADVAVTAVAGTAAIPDPVNPYQPLTISPPTDGELDLLIAKRQRGIRTSLWFMSVAAALTVGLVLVTNSLWFVNLIVIAFISGLMGFIIDSRALAKLRRQRAESAEPKF